MTDDTGSKAQTVLDLIRRGMVGDASAAFERLVASPPDDIDGLADLGQAALMLGRDEDALRFFSEATRLHPNQAAPHVGRGRALNRLGRWREAVQAMASAVAIDPDEDAALNRLKHLLDVEQYSARAALGRLARRGLTVASVLDVGASDGQWSRLAAQFWPHARFHMIEAFDHWRPALDGLCDRDSRFTRNIAAAGDTEGEVYFRNDPAAPYGGMASAQLMDGAWRVPQVSLAGEVLRLELPKPFLIKLDTHGFEWPILQGAEPLFADTALLVVETYAFRLHERAPLFDEVCSYMHRHGFRPLDVSDLLWRKRDEALWQFDLYFVRMDRPEFASSTYA